MNVRVWAVWVAAASLPALFSRNPLALILALLAVAVVRSAHGASRGERALPVWRFGLIAVLLAAAWNALTAHYGESMILTLPESLPLIGGRITLEAVVFGATNGLAVWLLLAAFNTFSAVVTPYQVLSLAPRVVRHAGLVVSIALTFFPQTLRTAREVREAQALRGHRPRHWRDLPAVVVPLLLNSLESAAQLAEAMEARGYGRGAAGGSGVGWLCLLAGALAQMYWRESIAGWLAMACGAIWIGVSERRAGRVTRYRRERWSSADALVGLASIASMAALLIVAAQDLNALAYTPYPRVTLPSLNLPIVAAALLLVAPAVRVPQGDAASDRLHGAASRLARG